MSSFSALHAAIIAFSCRSGQAFNAFVAAIRQPICRKPPARKQGFAAQGGVPTKSPLARLFRPGRGFQQIRYAGGKALLTEGDVVGSPSASLATLNPGV